MANQNPLKKAADFFGGVSRIDNGKDATSALSMSRRKAASKGKMAVGRTTGPGMPKEGGKKAPKKTPRY